MDEMTTTYLSIDLAKLGDDGERLEIGLASTSEPDQQGGVMRFLTYLPLLLRLPRLLDGCPCRLINTIALFEVACSDPQRFIVV